MASAGDLVVLQLRVVLRGVSPLIWRRILVRADSTIADLHSTLQTAFGWSDDHLHRFVIHGREYGISYICGVSFRDDPHEITLGSLGLRQGERFSYEYDLSSGWIHDVGVEAILPAVPTRCYPVCTGGRRAVPPEGCSGPWSFVELRQRYSPAAVALRLLEMFDELLEGSGDLDALRYEFDELRPWVEIDRFDRRTANQRLAEQFRARSLA